RLDIDEHYLFVRDKPAWSIRTTPWRRNAWRASRHCGIKPPPTRSARSSRSTVQAIRVSAPICSRNSPARLANAYGSKVAATAATICALAQRVEVADDEVRIMGSKSKLLRTLAAA